MKKNLVGALVFAGALAFTACNKEVVVIENGNGTENVADELQAGEGFIEIGVTNTGVGTRAGRPVGSSAAANNVNKVKLVAYKYDTEKAKWVADDNVKISKIYNEATADGETVDTNVFDWKKEVGPNGEGESIVDRYGKQRVKLSGLTESTTYRIVAYGYNDTDVYGFTDASTSENVILEAANAKSGFDVEEVFAGIEEVSTDGKGNFNKYISVIMERQVAGLLAYFDNVPSVISNDKVAGIRVVANRKTEKFSIPSFLEFNGIGSLEEKTVLLNFDLAKIALNYSEAAETAATYTFTDLSEKGYTGDEKDALPFAEDYKAPKGLMLKPNSIFGGRFVMPHDNHYDEQTLYVELYNEQGEALHTYNISINTSESTSNVDIKNKNQYDIRRNNFYSIGKKLYTDNTGGNPDPGTDPENPDPDKPIDLSKTTNITVIINDAWEVLHDMGIED